MTKFGLSWYDCRSSSSFVVQDYCGAGSLKDVMKLAQDTLTERQAKYVTSGTVKGLLCLHNMKILHLDIKSANILLTDAGDVKLGMPVKLESADTCHSRFRSVYATLNK